MKQNQQLKFIEAINKKGLELIKTKGHDYSGEDVLKNFKQMNELINVLEVDMTRIEGVHIFYMLLKVQRICNLIFSNKEAKNESLQDSLIDLRNYTDLLSCTIEEIKQNQ